MYMFNNYTIVKFKNGKYAVRKGWLFHRYLDSSEQDFWWSFPYVEFAQTSEKKARDMLSTIQDKGVVCK